MRPRFANRGSEDAPGALFVRMSGFNEAPIRESGKCFQGDLCYLGGLELQ